MYVVKWYLPSSPPSLYPGACVLRVQASRGMKRGSQCSYYDWSALNYSNCNSTSLWAPLPSSLWGLILARCSHVGYLRAWGNNNSCSCWLYGCGESFIKWPELLCVLAGHFYRQVSNRDHHGLWKAPLPGDTRESRPGVKPTEAVLRWSLLHVLPGH